MNEYINIYIYVCMYMYMCMYWLRVYHQANGAHRARPLLRAPPRPRFPWSRLSPSFVALIEEATQTSQRRSLEQTMSQF